ncbi:NAD(P)/FAD-dependent oxidoreductase [Negadavirga shengliensis]|uniref:NAD(P)/FAD-dependent oxidoreductase n=1 Tax=Negadavirga shengliensis TaxID=1389218 RepID=A0ABV9T8M8_9BACT
MKNKMDFEVIIVGGSYAGLSAALTLGRSLRRVLVIDSGKPCNSPTPHSHNFITQDGMAPREIAEAAKAQVLKYNTVEFHHGLAISGTKTEGGFEIKTHGNGTFTAQKLLFATGVFDIMPDIDGFAACWGKSVLHCPYCHGYEARHQKIGLLGNGPMTFEFCRHLSNWSGQLVLFTNGKSTLTREETAKIRSHQIEVIEKEILAFEHREGYLDKVVFSDGSDHQVSALFARAEFKQHCDIPAQMGCELTEHGLIKTDEFQRTSLPGIFAAGDNVSFFRAVSIAAASGTKAGAAINKELIEESF